MKSPQGWQYEEPLQILQPPKYTHVLMLMRTKQQMILQEEMSLCAMDAIQIFDIQVWLLHARCGSSHQNTTKVVTVARFLGGACRKVLQYRYPGVTQQFVKCINLCTTLEQRLQTRVPQIEEQLLMQVCTLRVWKNSTIEWESTVCWVSKSWNKRVNTILNQSTTSRSQHHTPPTTLYTNMNGHSQATNKRTTETSLSI